MKFSKKEKISNVSSSSSSVGERGGGEWLRIKTVARVRTTHSYRNKPTIPVYSKESAIEDCISPTEFSKCISVCSESCPLLLSTEDQQSFYCPKREIWLDR